MAETNYKASLKAAVGELAELLDKQEQLEDELHKLKERSWTLRTAVSSLAALCGVDAEKTYPNLFPESMSTDIGFTDAVREVFKSNVGLWLTPVEIRDKLQESGFDLANYSNPLASIHTILKRLKTSGQVDSGESFDNRTIYTWKSRGKFKNLV